MSAWYEADDELEALFGEEEGGFRPPRSFRAPAPRPFSPPRSTRPPRPSGAGSFRAAPSRPGSWRQRRRWPWLIYGVRPYANGYGFPVFPPRSDAEPEPLAEPYPDEEGEVEYERKPRGPLDIKIGTWEFQRINGWPLNHIRTSPPRLSFPPGEGVYIVVQDTKRRETPPLEKRTDDMLPIYVGESSNFQQRWKPRFEALHHLGITDSVGWLPHPIHIWFGPLTIEIPPGYRGDKKKEEGYRESVRKTVESAIIRTFLESTLVSRPTGSTPKGTQGLLRNQSSFHAFPTTGVLPRSKDVSIHIKNLLPPVPWWKSQALKKLAKKGYSHVTTTNIKTGVTGPRSDLIIRTGEKYELFFG